MKGLIRTGVLVAGTLMLAACGGGGGDSGDGNDASSDGGTKSAAKPLSLDANGYATRTVSISETSDVNAVAQLYVDIADSYGLINSLRNAAIDLSSGVGDCPGGGTVSVSHDGEDPNYDEHWTFDNCAITLSSFGPILVNGNYRYVDTLTGETAESETWQGHEEFNLFGNLEGSDRPFALKANMGWDQFYQSSGGVDSFRTIGRTDSLQLKVGDYYMAVTDLISRFEGDQFTATYSTSANLIGTAIKGYITVSTPTAVELTAGVDCPTKGIIKVESDGMAEFRYGSSASGTANAMAIWLNNQLLQSYDSCSSIPFSPLL